MTNWSNKPFRPRKVDFRREDLHRMRTVEGLSYCEIARRYRCDRTTVIYACERLGIKTAPKLSKAEWRDKVIAILGPEAWDAEMARAAE